MGGSLVTDNWSLQDIAELLTGEIEEDGARAICVNKEKGTHAYEPVSQTAIAFEALFDLITDLILRDQLLVDERYTSTWRSFATDLHALVAAKVIRPFGFLDQSDKLAGPRGEFVQRLCMTSSLRAAHATNAEAWNQLRQVPDLALSTTLWGGAGMLARAFISEKGYTPHPLRRRLFQQAGIVLPYEDAPTRLAGTIREGRVSLSKSTSGNDMLYALRLELPPLPILVIREASCASQLLPIALQMRSEYQALRDWLGEYQQSLDAGAGELATFENTLRSISKYIETIRGVGDSNAPTFTAGFGVLKVAFKGHPVERLRNQFGVRAAVNRLILSGSGLSELKKLLGFFGHRQSAVALRVIQHFGVKDKAVVA